MPKTKISEYSVTNSSNTDIEGINIDEGCAPSGINNAIRELMVHLKEFQTGASGDAFTFAGGVLISGTANTITGNVLMSGTNTITGSTTATFAAGAVGTPSIAAHGDTNTGIFFPAADTIAFAEGGAEAMRIDSSGNLLVNTTSPEGKVAIKETTAGYGIAFLNSAGDTAGVIGTTNESGTLNGLEINAYRGSGKIVFKTNATERMRIDSSGNVGIGATSISAASGQKVLEVLASSYGTVRVNANNGEVQGIFLANAQSDIVALSSITNHPLLFSTNDTERARITSGGDFLVGKTAENDSTAGFRWSAVGKYTSLVRDSGSPLFINRLTNDGTLVEFAQAETIEGTISVSGTTVSYNGGHLSRYAQTQGAKDESLLKGTVLSNLDEMNVYVRPTIYWTEEDELPEGVSVGDVKQESAVVENEQLNKVKVSDVEGDPNVAGVFVNWSYDEAHQVDEINMAMTGDMIIRIAQGVVVQKGDLLMSAGDGTAKPQGDDIVRSKTIAKVTSNHVTCTYADGSYCVPCVLMAC